MSKTMNHRNIRGKLMTTVSALALGAAVYGVSNAQAGDADRPIVWIELGGQSEQVNGFGDPFDPPFTSELIADGFTSPIKSQRALSQSLGEEGTISFQPENSDWIFFASIRYGRAGGRKSTHEQTPAHFKFVIGSHTGYLSANELQNRARFSETRTDNSETHTILDFQAGKDMGLGLLDRGGKSTISFGVRFAQFVSNQHLGIKADPDFTVPSNIFAYQKYHHTYSVTSHVERSFHGVGPSLSWHASVPLVGNVEDSEITLDWGVNAAALFGRQKVRGHHQTVGTYYKGPFLQPKYLTSQIHRSGNPDRSRNVVVPNVGGFAGLSFRYADAKVSFGYRGDFFFGAMDGGIDTRKSATLGFNGPFASISVGIGD
jgi:hypothetical protein